MTAPDWVDTDHETMATSDSALHAGITVDLWRGNLLRAFEQSVYDVQGSQHSTGTIDHAFSTADKYEDFVSTWGGITVPMRRKLDGTWRGLRVTCEARLATSTAKATVQLLPLDRYTTSLRPHSTAGIYTAPVGELTIEASTWTVVSTTISSIGDRDVGYAGASHTWSDGIPTTRVDTCVIQAIGTCDETVDLNIRNVRIREVI